MLVSRCCKSDIYIELDYYVCEKCGRACDIIIKSTLGAYRHDARIDATKSQEFYRWA